MAQTRPAVQRRDDGEDGRETRKALKTSAIGNLDNEKRDNISE